jgi:hypothetical protein
MRLLLLIFAGLFTAVSLSAHGPLYVVNGVAVESIEGIAQSDIETIETLPADEETIAKWGIEASEGVVLVILRYDSPARFSTEGYSNFTDYLVATVKWPDNMPAERVSLRIIIDETGRTSIEEVLESTSRQFLGRVTKAIEDAPLWEPAQRKGEGVASQHLVNLKLPLHKELPTEPFVIIR